MDKKEEEKIFKCIKESLQNDFGNFHDSMVYELMAICKALPGFLKFYLSCFDLTILEALDRYLKLMQKQKPDFCRKLTVIHRKQNDVLYYMLIGLLFREAFDLLNLNSNVKTNIDYTNSVKELMKNKNWKR